MSEAQLTWTDTFAGSEAGGAPDPDAWVTSYLPAWSSREAAQAVSRVTPEGLELSIPVDHPRWCEGDHEPPLRVSGLMSGSFSGPVGSTRAQQRYREGLEVQEEQHRFEGVLARAGRVSVTARMDISPRSMAALWLSGFEDDERQEQCGEICVFEIFGNALSGAATGRPEAGPESGAEVGMGVKAFRDPVLTHDFAAPWVGIDVREEHEYAVAWSAAEALFSVDGEPVRHCVGPPTYPMQLMLAVFDFPQWSNGDDDHLVPTLTVRQVSAAGMLTGRAVG